NPKFRIGIFDDKSEGDYNENVHFALTPNGFAFDDFYLDGKNISVVSLLSRDKSYVVNSVKYQDVTYEWDIAQRAYVNESKKITVQKSQYKQNIQKVNLLRSISGCHYEYLVVNWDTSDEKSDSREAVTESILTKIEASENKWTQAFLTIKDSSCDQSFTETQDGLRNCSGEKVKEDEERLRKSLTIEDDSELTDLLNGVCLESLRNLGYDTIITLFERIQKRSSLSEKYEVALLRLMSVIHSDYYDKFFTYLEKDGNRVIKHLVEEMDDHSSYFWDGNNYTNFIGGLIYMYRTSIKSWEKRVTDEDYFLDKMILKDPIDKVQSFEQLFEGKAQRYYNTFVYNPETGDTDIEQNECAIKILAVTEKGAIGACDIPHIIGRATLSPLSPVLIEVSNDLPVINMALGIENGDEKNTLIVPALFLKYALDKTADDAMFKSAMTTLDVVTITTGVGVIFSATTKAKRIWALMEVAGAVGNIAVNTIPTTTPEVQTAVDLYNGTMGIIGLKNIGKGVVNYVKELPGTTRNVLKENKGIQNLLKEQYTKWRLAYNKLSPSERKLLEDQEKGWKKLGFVEDIVNNKYRQIFLDDPIVKGFTKEVQSDKVLLSNYPNLSVEELTAIKIYTSEEIRNGNKVYQLLNSELRQGILSDFNRGLKELLDNGLNKLVPHQGNTFRGVHGAEADIAKTWKVGEEITFKDFKSSSTKIQIAAYNFSYKYGDNVVYEIVGSKGYNVCNISCNPNEMEILLQSDLKFRVKDVNNNFMIFDEDYEYQKSFIKVTLELIQ
ncbi:MAG: hypothetical protein LBQ84_05580, partial [Flavobacteriaceae bacterium]|nr:hypothetical protein [Flavobacteriaceae bacterium]